MRVRQAFPLDSHVTYEADGTPVYDRAITSAPLRKLIKKLVTDGVLPNPSTNLQVSAGAGMNILVESGFALCNGCMALEESQRTLAVQASDTTYDRIDTVVLRLNDNDSARTCDLYVLQGVAAASPIRPSLTRTESIWEIGLADLFITPNSSEISNQRITDTRYETERCGIISAINEFDTTTLYDQIQADLAGFKEEEQAQFVEWFDYMKDQLSEDAAGNLQLQIDEINELEYEETEELAELVPKENIRTTFGKIKLAVKNVISIVKLLGSTDISKIEDGTVTGILSALNTKTSSLDGDMQNKAYVANVIHIYKTASQSSGGFANFLEASGTYLVQCSDYFGDKCWVGIISVEYNITYQNTELHSRGIKLAAMNSVGTVSFSDSPNDYYVKAYRLA